MKAATESATSPAAISWLPGTSAQQGGFSIAVGAALWGLYWIPLRYLHEQGIPGLWAVTIVMAASIIPAAVFMFRQQQVSQLAKPDTWFIASALALSTVLYFIGFILSDVMRVVFLFYLLPIWTTISARIIYKEPITPTSIVVILLALGGLTLLLGGGNTMPIPSNLGDWCGLLAGLCWGVSLTLLRSRENVNSVTALFATFVTGTVFALFALFILHLFKGVSAEEAVSVSVGLSPKWFLIIICAVAFSALMMFPSMISQIWGAQRVPAPTAALLTMTEVLVATVSAYLLIGTELNRVSIIGAVVIITAVLIDIAYKFYKD